MFQSKVLSIFTTLLNIPNVFLEYHDLFEEIMILISFEEIRIWFEVKSDYCITVVIFTMLNGLRQCSPYGLSRILSTVFFNSYIYLQLLSLSIFYWLKKNYSVSLNKLDSIFSCWFFFFIVFERIYSYTQILYFV